MKRSFDILSLANRCSIFKYGYRKFHVPAIYNLVYQLRQKYIFRYTRLIKNMRQSAFIYMCIY